MLILHIFAPCHSWRGRREAEPKTTAWLLVRLYGCTGASGRIVHLLRVRRPATRGHQWPLARNERWQKVPGATGQHECLFSIYSRRATHGVAQRKYLSANRQGREHLQKSPPTAQEQKAHQTVSWLVPYRSASGPDNFFRYISYLTSPLTIFSPLTGK